MEGRGRTGRIKGNIEAERERERGDEGPRVRRVTEFNQRIETKQIEGVEGKSERRMGSREKTVQITGGFHNGKRKEEKRWKRERRRRRETVVDGGGGQRRQGMEGYYE